MSATGLKALPEQWIAMGKSRGSISTAIAKGDVKVDRDLAELTLDAVNPVYPDLSCTDLSQGKVSLLIDMPWPVKDVTLSGPMESQGDRVVLTDENGQGRCELTQPRPGQVHGLVHRAEGDELWFLYESS
ncbi:hypothetical protein IV102_31800 [bacterium]|nr:hypothetical protein [bacterium]